MNQKSSVAQIPISGWQASTSDLFRLVNDNNLVRKVQRHSILGHVLSSGLRRSTRRLFGTFSK